MMKMMNDENEVQKITAARTPMTSNRIVCVTCNQTFEKKHWWKKIYPERTH